MLGRDPLEMKMQDDQDQTQTGFSDIKSGLQDAGNKISDTMGTAKDRLADKAHDIAAEGKEALAGRAQEVQASLSSAIDAFSGAIKAASEHLADSEQTKASQFAMQAAGGLERMSASLRDKPVGDLLGEIRRFGAQNPGVLVGGAVLAGLALGRLIKSSSPTGQSSDFGMTSNDSNAGFTGSGFADDEFSGNDLSRNDLAGSDVSSTDFSDDTSSNESSLTSDFGRSDPSRREFGQ